MSVQLSVLYIAIILCALLWPSIASIRSRIESCHNNARSRVGVRGLSWSYSLASSAQREADRCVGCHNGYGCRVASRKTGGGENLAWRGTSRDNDASESDWYNRCMAWVNERNYWTYAAVPNGCRRGACGHYTQIIWEGTTQVGCGWKDDCRAVTSSGTTMNQILVCHYSPSGNYRGQYPYGGRYEDETSDCLEGDEAKDYCLTWDDEKVSFTLIDTKCHNQRPLYFHDHNVIDASSYLYWVDPTDLGNSTYEGDGYWTLSSDPNEASGHAMCEEYDLEDCGAGSWVADQYTDSGVVTDTDDSLYINAGSCGQELKSSHEGKKMGIVVLLVALFVIIAIVALVWCQWKKRRVNTKEMIKDMEEEENSEQLQEIEVETETGLVQTAA